MSNEPGILLQDSLESRIGSLNNRLEKYLPKSYCNMYKISTLVLVQQIERVYELGATQMNRNYKYNQAIRLFDLQHSITVIEIS